MKKIEDIAQAVMRSVNGTPAEKLAALRTAVEAFLMEGPNVVAHVDTVVQLMVNRDLAGCQRWIDQASAGEGRLPRAMDG